MLKPSHDLAAVPELQCHDLLRGAERSRIARQTATTASERRVPLRLRSRLAAIITRIGHCIAGPPGQTRAQTSTT